MPIIRGLKGSYNLVVMLTKSNDLVDKMLITHKDNKHVSSKLIQFNKLLLHLQVLIYTILLILSNMLMLMFDLSSVSVLKKCTFTHFCFYLHSGLFSVYMHWLQLFFHTILLLKLCPRLSFDNIYFSFALN